MTVHDYHLRGCLTVLALGAILSGALLLLVAYKTRADWSPELEPTGYTGNVQRGSMLVETYGCTSCHDVPGHPPAGYVGPSFEAIGRRSYIAGEFANNEIWMTLWIEHPQQLKPNSAMPDLHVTRRDARDIAAYLATLR